MRVVLNQLSAVGARTGVGHYTAQLVRCLRGQSGADQVDIFPTDWFCWAWQAGSRARSSLDASVGRIANPSYAGDHQPAPSIRSRLGYSVLTRLRDLGRFAIARSFQRTAARRGFDLYHEPNFIPLPCDVPTLVTIHDLSVWLHPEWHPADRVAFYQAHFRRSLEQCAHFLTVSESSRQEIIQHLGIRPERVTCVYNGIRPGLGPLPKAVVAARLQRLGLPPGYLLHVGTIEPRKNLLRLMQAYCALPERLRDRWPLLLVGKWGWNSTDVAEFLHGVGRHRGVRHIGYVAEEDLAVLYNGARAVVFPTRYEGFGLPAVEAMACGGAVLASNAAALAELIGGRVPLLAPEDVLGWRDAMARVLQDDDWRQSLCRGVVDVARPFTWERCAAETFQLYRRLCAHTSAITAPPPPQRHAA